MITSCTKCGGAYEAGSEEQAYEPVRLCFTCRSSSAPRSFDAQAAALLLTYESAVPNIISLREALQRAFDAGRAKGRIEGLEQAKQILAEKQA